MRHARNLGLSTGYRFGIALVATVGLHGAMLALLTGMTTSTPQPSRVMVGVFVKSPAPKSAEPSASAPPPPPASETPPPQPPRSPPPQPPRSQPPQPPPKPAVSSVRAKTVAPEKPVPKVKPVSKVKPVPKVKPVSKVKPVPKVKPNPETDTQSVVDPSAAVTDPAPPSTPLPPATDFDSTEHQAVSPPQFHAEYLNNPRPRYPLMSRKRHEEGVVRLRVRVDAKGHPESVRILVSSGYPRLDQAASSVVQEWRFVPARQGGRTLAAWVEVPIQFNLEK